MTRFDSFNLLCFKVIDKANSEFNLKSKEALDIIWRKANLNAQENHLAPTLSLQLLSLPCSFLSLFAFCCCFFLGFFVFLFAFLFHLLFLLSLTLIINCLNDTLLLFHLITIHLVSHLSLSSLVFIISMLIISIFYSLNYTSYQFISL